MIRRRSDGQLGLQVFQKTRRLGKVESAVEVREAACGLSRGLIQGEDGSGEKSSGPSTDPWGDTRGEVVMVRSSDQGEQMSNREGTPKERPRRPPPWTACHQDTRVEDTSGSLAQQRFI